MKRLVKCQKLFRDRLYGARMPGEARARWAILAEVIKARKAEEEKVREGTKRSGHTFGLLTWGPEAEGGWRRVGLGETEAEVRLGPAAPSLTQLVGFNNTGNVCVWPSEECLAVHLLNSRDSYAGLRVLELGGGMTSLAGLLLAATGRPASVTLTDGNPASAASLARVVERTAAGTGGSSLLAAELRWDEAEAVATRAGQYDLILSADCIFFTSRLAEAMAGLLAPGGQALVMAPGREGTFDSFRAEAARHFAAVEEVEQYCGQVWKAHEACLDLPDYRPDIHYPRLLSLRL
jgi:calmodulin-lysine N-methyltransferase